MSTTISAVVTAMREAPTLLNESSGAEARYAYRPPS